jgi:radical SAM superfamily enzyme YgiQ (UPF0313 family)
VIGATVYTYHVNDVLSFMCETKVNNPNVKTIVGGPHPTALPQTMAASEGIDVVVRGEGEVTFRELIEKYERKESINDVDGIAYSVNGEVRINRSRELIADLDTLPYPAWSLLPIDTYKHPEYGHPRMNRPYLINMLATRGCPYSCIFCGAADVWGRKMRLHSPARIVAEMRRLNEEFGVRSVRFADSTLTVNRDWVLEICDLLVSMDIDVAWSANARASTIDEEMLTRMKHAKCKCLTLGVESGDQNVLNIAKKHQSLDEVRHAFNIMRTTGIFSWAFFMIGLPGETKESIKKTIAFAEEIDPDQVSICAYATPYPGTELYQMAMDEANIAVIPWEDFHHSRKILYVPKDLTRDDIEAGKIAFSKSLRPHKRHIGRSFSE